MSAARIYLDVDGVLNAVSRHRPQWGWGDPARVEVNGWPITYSPELVAVINNLSNAPGLDIFWLTTWCHDAPSKLVPALGLLGSEWPVVGYEHWKKSDPNIWWKLPAIQEHLDGFEGRVLWIDDDLHYVPEALAWVNGQPSIATLCPRTELGITLAQSRTLREFGDRLSGSDR